MSIRPVICYLLEMIIFCLSLAVCGISALSNSYDYFSDQVQRNIDHDVDPCDNFYRHACPFAMSKDDTIANYAEQTLGNLINIQKEKSPPLPNTIIERLYAILNPNVTMPDNAILHFLAALRNTSYLIEYFRDNKIHLRDEHAKLLSIKENMLNITKENMAMTKHKYGTNITQEMIDSVDKHQFVFGYELEVNAYKKYQNVLIQMDRIYEGHFSAQNKTPITEIDIQLRKDEFYDILTNVFVSVYVMFKSLNQQRLDAVRSVTTFNAGNYRPHYLIDFLEGLLIPLRNTSDAAMYGFFGSTFGHELMHTYFWGSNKNRGYAFEKEWTCVVHHAHKVCETYAEEGLCLSGFLTYTEDAADYEGAKLAYKAFLREFGDRLEDPVSNGMNVTNQQMFFYSFAKGFCSIDNDHHLDPNGKYNTHPPSFVRVNGALSLMKGFHETFKCQAGDRMRVVADGHCTSFGNPVRRY